MWGPLRHSALALAALLVARGARGADGEDGPVTLNVVGEREGDGAPSSRVGRREMDERQSRSAPDALVWEPGVYVQQTAHGQASPYIRGRTGQQTVLIFDGVRLNNSSFRQGPNQYFFTVDARSVRSVEVVRGGASTRYGSDAIGGAIIAHPMEPSFDPERNVFLRPRASLRFGSADGEFGERFQLDAQLGRGLQALVGIGFRRVGQLRSGGVVRSPETGAAALVPTFAPDGVTMLGTGFKELTADARVVGRLGDDHRLVAAAYFYRQYDTPRTDQCPPAYAPRSECLRYEEQFRTLAYLAWDATLRAPLTSARVTLSYQRQHERRRRDRPSILVENGGRDDVDTLGLSARIDGAASAITPWWSARFGLGGDLYLDRLGSEAWTRLTDLGVVLRASRGQYVGGSRYATGGVYAVATNELGARVIVRLGARAGVAAASTPEERASTTAAIERQWFTHAGFARVEWSPHSAITLMANYDRSFRAPNLDDLTSRQQTGPGFQFENAGLSPEYADTLEAGVRVRTPHLLAEASVYRSFVRDAITRSLRASGDCPPETPQCGASWSRFQLVNVPGLSTIDGVELAVGATLSEVVVRGTLTYAYGEGPNPQERSSVLALAYPERVPLSRIAPLNGTLEARWAPEALGRRLWLGGALRWAGAQTRLAPSDRSDVRIPDGGTPGFAVFDLRAGYRIDRRLFVAIVLENVGDVAYRHHGSSINGAGRSISIAVESGL